MVTSPSRPHDTMKHFHRLSNGRGFSFNVDSDSDEIPLSESFVHLAKTTPQSEDHLKYLVTKSLQGLRSGYSPTLCESGVGGTYFMRDEFNRTIGVFKPHDEEMGCMNNPKVCFSIPHYILTINAHIIIGFHPQDTLFQGIQCL